MKELKTVQDVKNEITYDEKGEVDKKELERIENTIQIQHEVLTAIKSICKHTNWLDS